MTKGSTTGNEWLEYVKDCAKVEKEFGVEKWVYIVIKRTCYKTGEIENLYAFDLPRELYNIRMWIVDWRVAKCKCMYPRDRVVAYYSYYDKKTGLELGWNSTLGCFIAAKAQVTKVERKIKEYLSYQKQNNLFFNESTDELLNKTRIKLQDKIKNVEELEANLKNMIANDSSRFKSKA